MGGTGSGTWTRSETRGLTKYRIKIDIRNLKADIQSGVDTAGVVTSCSEYGHRDSLSYVVMDGYLVLGANPALNTVLVTRGLNIIEITQTACHFGGYRNWLNCPACQQRVGIIYLSERRLACRLCCNLTYSSQRDSKLERLITRTQKAWCALGGTGCLGEPVPLKPRGMHWRTYWLRLQRVMKATKLMNKEFGKVFPSQR